MSKENEIFISKKTLLELEREIEKEKHKMRMSELEYTRESDRLHHEREMERQRIKSAEIKRTLDMKRSWG